MIPTARARRLPWWAEYPVDFDPNLDDLDEFHSFDVNAGIKGADSWGNDYLAGGAHNDLVFGQMGNDIVHGRRQHRATPRSGELPRRCLAQPRRLPGRPTRTATTTTHAGTCDLVGDLDLIPSFDAATDGQDYVEGNGGNDTCSAATARTTSSAAAPTSSASTTPYLRPDGADLHRSAAAACTATATTTAARRSACAVPVDRHGHDADTIVGDNGRIIRIVGINGCDYRDTAPAASGCAPPPPSTSRTSTTTSTASRSSSAASRCSTTRRAAPTSGPTCSASASTGTVQRLRLARPRAAAAASCCPCRPGTQHVGLRRATGEIAGNDEIHGGCGDDSIYLGGGNDVAYGDADDDDIIGGWGNDWISGGTGQDGILGDDGRIFTSRNSDCGYTAGPNTDACATPTAPAPATAPASASRCTASPPSGRSARAPRTTRSLCGDYLDQYIATPGEVQTAVINIGGDCKKTVDLTPYNLHAERHRTSPSSTPTTPTT